MDDSRFDQLIRFLACEFRNEFFVFALDAFSICHQNQFFSLECRGNLGSNEVGIDVQGFSFSSFSGGGDDRDEPVLIKDFEYFRVNFGDFSDQSHIDNLGSVGLRRVFDPFVPLGMNKVTVFS